MTCWVYMRTEPNLFTVGFFTPDGEWNTDDDFNDREEARERCNFLNGGKGAEEHED